MNSETPRQIVFSAMRGEGGFRQYLDVHQPRTAAGASLVRFIRSDPRFPAELSSAAAFRSWVRYGPRMPWHVRQEAGHLWQGYAAWRRRRERSRAEAEESARNRAA